LQRNRSAGYACADESVITSRIRPFPRGEGQGTLKIVRDSPERWTIGGYQVTETPTVQAPPAADKAPKEPTPLPVTVAKAFGDAPTWAHVRFTEWAEQNGIENIDDLPAVQVVAATTRLYNVFRAEPAFIAERETQRAERATKTKVKPIEEMTPEEAAKELDKIQAAQAAALKRQQDQDARKAAIQAMLAEAGVTVATDADEADEVDDTEDTETAEAF